MLPLDRRTSAKVVVDLVVGLAVPVVIVAWQAGDHQGTVPVREDDRGYVRRGTALSALVRFHILMMASASAADFRQPLTRTDALYFSTTVFSTVGFGDITARS